MGTSILGSRVLRAEDPLLLTGEARFAEDVPVDAVLHAIFVRSFRAHARVIAVDVREASAMPGVVGIFTAADLDRPDMWTSGALPEAFARPVLARDVVRFVGEAVAVIVAESRAQAMDAAEAVLVDADPLPVVLDPEAAASLEAPLLFPGAGTNVAMRLDTGDVPPALEGAEVVARSRVVAQELAPVPLEVNSATVVPDPETGVLTVWASIQDAFSMRDRIADSLKVDASKVRVVAQNVGGGFGSKIDTYPEHVVVAALARRLGRPVRWVETRSESMTAMTHGRARVAHVELGATRDGTITGLRIHILANFGAYPGLDVGQALLSFQMATGPYRIPRLGFALTGVVTTTTPKAAYRGAGRPEATQILEVAMDRLAAELGMDPAELRRRNLIPADAFPYSTLTGAEYDSGDYRATMDRALGIARYDDLRAEQARRRTAGDEPLLGIGISSYVEITAVGPLGEYGSVAVEPDGAVTVTAGTGPTGQGHQTAFAQVAAALLAVPFGSVRVLLGDTGSVKRGQGTSGSRSLQLGGTAVYRAGEQVVDKARRLASHLLEVAAEDLELKDGRFGVVGAPDRSMTWTELAVAAADGDRLPQGMDPGLSASGEVTQGSYTFPFGTHVAVVEVDPETGRVELLRHVAVDDCGRILNPMLVDGQVHGGLAQGIAQALYEEVVYDDQGNPLTANLTTYEMPAAPDLPSFTVAHTETSTPLNPLGAKGIGESATIGSTPAVQNAVIDAVRHLGVHHLDLPLTPERVWRAIRDAGRS